MSADKQTIDKRVAEANAALIEDLKLPGDESDVREYIEHHLEEVESEYWTKQFGESKPAIDMVASRLVVKPFWMEEALEGEADLDRVDFTLPGDITDYVLCVEYAEDGKSYEITMES